MIRPVLIAIVPTDTVVLDDYLERLCRLHSGLTLIETAGVDLEIRDDESETTISAPDIAAAIDFHNSYRAKTLPKNVANFLARI